MTEEFTKPLNKWIEEEEPVERVVKIFDPQTKKLSEETVIEKQKVKVIYEKTVNEWKMCNAFEHDWIVTDSHAYIISCKKCPLKKHIMPGREYIDQEGHVRLRDGNQLIA